MSTEDAKAYLSCREVPRLFECLMTGLMFHRPTDHIQYLIECLEKVKTKGQAELTWNMFVEVRSAKTPLPPITPDNGKRPTSRGRITPKEEGRAITPVSKTTPLPPIGSSGLPNVPIIFLMGGPGSGKAIQATKLVDKHPGWINVNIGEMLRAEITNKEADGKWKAVKDLVVSGELAPENVLMDMLMECFKSNTEANGFIIQGFPRDMEQAKSFEQTISRVDAVFLLDCEEDKLTKAVLKRGQKTGRLDDSPSALARRMATFKEKTLPVLKYFDDGGKLYIVDGSQDKEQMHDELSIIFETLLQNLENGRIPSPPAEGRPSSSRRGRRFQSPRTDATDGAAPALSPTPPKEPSMEITLPTVAYIPPPEIKVKDEGRKDDLPAAPIIFLAGGPGSGKGTQCQKITARYPDIVHLSMGDILRKEITDKGTADEKWGMITKLLNRGEMAPVDVTEDLLIRSMKEHSDAKAYLVEGYPRDALQYESFNRDIGGHTFSILLDCDDQYLHKRLLLRGGGGSERIDDNVAAIERKLAFFAQTTLPLLKSIEDESKLIVIDAHKRDASNKIDGDRDEDEIFYDIVKCLDFSLYGVELETAKTSDQGGQDAGEQDEADGKEPVVEETMVATSAPLLGGDTGNPEHTQQLDAAAAEAKADDQLVSAGQEHEDVQESTEQEGQDDVVNEETEQSESATEQLAQDESADEPSEQDQVANEQGEQSEPANEQTEQDETTNEQLEQDEATTEQTDQNETSNEQAEQEETANQQADQTEAANEQADQIEEASEQADQTEEANEQADQTETANEQAEQDELANEQAGQNEATNEQEEQNEAANEQEEQQGQESQSEQADPVVEESGDLAQANNDTDTQQAAEEGSEQKEGEVSQQEADEGQGQEQPGETTESGEGAQEQTGEETTTQQSEDKAAEDGGGVAQESGQKAEETEGGEQQAA